ncbi:hypothetical protein psyc5s11_22990 [Clostridium gelidum]|uniref:Uncharacterized protein n=1 Tax=Clostridium gelidum TaxID=704125 RepID=A0ABN6J0F9_9CLOT|nr:hypothetical protein [Clostridium gelidum]BCZ46232.1 hypothetical protein psyc5s11_22990 [Clostridium gelidum]
MAKTKNWELTVDGIEYNVEFYRKIFSRGLRVNGQDIPLQKSKTLGTTSETHFLLGSKNAILVIIGNKIDVALDGKYIDSGNDYVPVASMPKWAWIFIILNGLVIIGGGALPFLLAFLGVTISIRTSISAKMKFIPKLLICIVITIINYALIFTIIELAIAARGGNF